jgi:hypothetical protein
MSELERILDEANRMPEGIWDGARVRLLNDLKKEIKIKVDKKITLYDLSARLLEGYVQNIQYTQQYTPDFLCKQALIHAKKLLELLDKEII